MLVLMIDACSALGSKPSGERLVRIERSSHYRDGRFRNRLPTIHDGMSFSVVRDYFVGGSDHRTPEEPVPVVRRSAADFDGPGADLRVTWLGHSTFLLEVDGVRLLVDPVWGERASPSSFFGAPRFFAPPLAIEDLPPVDAVVLQVVCTPARHFSGRSLGDRDRTLWAGWAFLGTERRIYYSGDTAMTPELAEIGDRLGPFDLTLIETGAYDAAWADVHLGPEQAVEAHRMVRGDLLVPVHWGLFDLALHGWTEPAERTRAAAEEAGVAVAFPRPGESLSLDDHPTEPWWPDVPWKSSEEAPIVSSGFEIVP
jgi:L-ascorbate metabolism protein UlaG (beta-lactamase superfamily)